MTLETLVRRMRREPLWGIAIVVMCVQAILSGEITAEGQGTTGLVALVGRFFVAPSLGGDGAD